MNATLSDHLPSYREVATRVRLSVGGKYLGRVHRGLRVDAPELFDDPDHPSVIQFKDYHGLPEGFKSARSCAEAILYVDQDLRSRLPGLRVVEA